MFHRTLQQQRTLNDISQMAGMFDRGAENLEWLPTVGAQQATGLVTI